MRITYLHQYFNTRKMPGSTRSFEIAKRLVESGHKVNMITSDRNFDKSGDWYLTNEDGIHVHWLPIPYDNAMPYSRRILSFFRFAIKACSYACLLKADVIFATSTPLTIALPALFVAKRMKIPMVFEVRDLWPAIPIAIGALKGPMIPLALWLERKVYRNSTKIIALSDGMRQGISRTGCSSQKIHVIPNSCDNSLFHVSENVGIALRNRFNWLKDRPLVLYAGAFGKINGVGYLAKLAAETKKIRPGIRFLAVGDGHEFESVKKLAQELGVLNQNFFLFGQLPKEEMPTLYSAATISISLVIDLPELWANSANKFFDSLSAGRPIAINYCGWQAKLLRESSAGIVLPVSNMSIAAKKLVKTLDNETWLKNAENAALKLAKGSFDRDFLTKKVENVLIQAFKTSDMHKTVIG